MAADDDALIGTALGLDRYSHHLLLCGSGPRCCSGLRSAETWSHLQTRLRELERKGRLEPRAVLTSQVSCLKVCRSGPILVAYPGGVWYREVTPEVCDRILHQHVLKGQVVESHAFARNQEM